MIDGWKIYKLPELGSIGRGKSKHRPRNAQHLYGGDYPFIQTGDVKAANHRLTNHSQTYSEAGLKQSKLWPKDTMCITIAANIAETAIIDYSACFPDSIIGFIPNKTLCDIDFVEYLLQYFKKQIQSHAIGSVQDNINLGTFQKVEFNVPPLKEQKAIASILSALDDKIELNLQMNKTLEKMAMALYKYWFVDFGPFQDGAFVDSELGKIPEGWEVKPLSEVTSKITDGAHHSPKSDGNGLPMASVKDMRNWGFNLKTCRRIGKLDYEKLVNQGCRPMKNDVVIAKDGSYLKHAFVVEKDLDIVLLSSIAILKPNEQLNPQLLNLYLKLGSVKSRMKSIVSGAAIQRIVLKEFRKFLTIVPPIDIQNKALEKIEVLILRCWNNNNENQTLTNLRDTLLPKLISGEVRVKDAAKLITQQI